jgi:predicted GTPase
VAALAHETGRRVAVIRHPMAYGDLARQAAQRFATLDDLDRAGVTVEEREEYEPHIARGSIVYAGVDYAVVLSAAEREADLIVWDGGNNDFPFLWPDLHIVVADPLRPGHELRYHPGETNLRMAHVVVINKVDTARPEDVEIVRRNTAAANSAATIVDTASPVTVDRPDALAGRRAIVVEDGPTVTHGGMAYGAGFIAAGRHRATVIDPRPFAVGSIAQTLRAYPHLVHVLPAMGYSAGQLRELEETLAQADAEVIVIGTPVDLRRMLRLNKPAVRVTYELEDRSSPGLDDVVRAWLSAHPSGKGG